MVSIRSFIVLTLISLTAASDDFISETVGLGTSQAVEFDFNNKKIWSVFTRSQESQVTISGQETYLNVPQKGKAAIVTSQFSMMYGKVDFKMKASVGAALTSCKISGAYSGIGLLVDGKHPTKFTASYNGTYGDPDIIETGVDLTLVTNTVSIRYTPDVIMWYVNDRMLKSKYRSNFTNPIDIANWPTSPDTVNFMVETYEDNAVGNAMLSTIVVQDYTAGKYYEPMHPGVLVQTTGKNKYPSALSSYVKKANKMTAIIKREDKIEDSSVNTTFKNETANATAPEPKINYTNGGAGVVSAPILLSAAAAAALCAIVF